MLKIFTSLFPILTVVGSVFLVTTNPLVSIWMLLVGILFVLENRQFGDMHFYMSPNMAKHATTIVDQHTKEPK